jgi:hypothetical protein
MSLLGAVRTHLTGETDITDIVSTRIYNATAPPNPTKPYLVMEQPDNEHHAHMTGASELAEPTVRIDGYGADPDVLQILATAIRLRLNRRRGTIGTGDDAMTVRVAKLTNDLARHIPPSDNDQVGVHVVSMRYEVKFAEAIV